jgi:hypothetical protein
MSINPDDPPWNAPVALLVWFMSVALIAVVPAVALLFYIFSSHGVSKANNSHRSRLVRRVSSCRSSPIYRHTC